MFSKIDVWMAKALDSVIPARRRSKQIERAFWEVSMESRATALDAYSIGDQRWRTRHDSNVWPPPSEGGALSS